MRHKPRPPEPGSPLRTPEGRGRPGAGAPAAGKLPTSEEVYHRLRWDPRFAGQTFTIGYDARELGMLEMPLAAYEPGGDIPWHRIWYFRCGDTVVWDRRTRTDRISGARWAAPAASGAAAAPQEAAPSSVEAEEPAAGSVGRSAYRYDAGAGAWLPVAAEDGAAAGHGGGRLTIISLNVLFDLYDGELVQAERRRPAILSFLRRSDADLIALQEVTPAFLEALLREPWARAGYFASDSPLGETVRPYGQVLLSRRPLRRVWQRALSASKRVIIGEVLMAAAAPAPLAAGGQAALVAVVHLASNRAADAPRARTAQLWTVLDALSGGALPGGAGATDALVIGDFNAEGELDELIAAYGYSDIWPALRPGEPGYTYDPAANALALQLSRSGLSRRYDRVLVRSPGGRLRATEIAVVKDAPPGLGLPLSDHFALRCTLQIAGAAAPAGPPAPLQHAPVHRSAAVLIPPEVAWPPIQAIRARHDKSYARWMPHVNLLYGFVAEEHFAAAAALLSRVLAGQRPFTLRLLRFGSFAHAASHTIWLAPESDPPRALPALQAAMQAAFPACDEQTRRAGAFCPHLSVAQVRTAGEVARSVAAWERGLRAIEFPVTEVALISRRGEEPFAVRCRIALGTGEIWMEPVVVGPAAVGGEAAPEVGGTGREGHDGGAPALAAPRAAALAVLRAACAAALARGGWAEPALHLLGSSRLGTAAPDSDLDVLCVGPQALPRGEFFSSVREALARRGALRARVVQALVPVLELELDGVAVDLAYAGVPERAPEHLTEQRTDDRGADARSIRQPPAAWLADRALDAESRLGLLAVADADALLRTAAAGAGLAAFRAVLRALVAWARASGVYGNAYGYLGGFSWAVIAAWACAEPGEAGERADALLERLFTALAAWDWARPLVVPGSGAGYTPRGRRDRMMILAPADPPRNSARNVTEATAVVLQQEFARAARLCQRLLRQGRPVREALRAPRDLLGEQAVRLGLTLRCGAEDDLRACTGWLEGNLLTLLLELERAGQGPRPLPGLQRALAGAEGTVWIGLAADRPDLPDLGVALVVAGRFVDRFAAWPQRPAGAALSSC